MIFKLEDISFTFNSSTKILDNLNLSLESGKIYALMGANGAGKSTLFNIITGFIPCKSGEIYLNDTEITKLKPYKRNLLGIGRTFQDLRIINRLTVSENIELAFKHNLSDRWYSALIPSNNLKKQSIGFTAKTEEILNQFHLDDVRYNLASDISYGQQKLLTIACCVANDAQILLLDEPVAGINPVYREHISLILKDLKNKGKTILLIEHNTDFISEVADSIYFLADGKLAEFQNIELLRQNQNVINAYM